MPQGQVVSDSTPPSIVPEGEHTQKVRAIAREEARDEARATLKPHLPRQRTTAEVVAALVSEGVVVALVAVLALTTQDMTFRWVALGIAASRLGVTLKGLGGGGPPAVGPIGAGVAAMLGPLLRHSAATVTVLALALAPVTACSAQVRHAAHDGIVEASSASVAMHDALRVQYMQVTDELRQQVMHTGGSRADYDHALAAIDAEFDARAKALTELVAGLLAAAVALDSTTDVASAQGAARAALRALDDAAEVLGNGDAMPPTPIPLAVRAVILKLTSIVSTDAGAEVRDDHE